MSQRDPSLQSPQSPSSGEPWWGQCGYAYRFQDKYIQKPIMALYETDPELDCHYQLMQYIGCMFRDMVAHHDGLVMTGHMRYVMEKYQSAICTLHERRSGLQEENATERLHALCERWDELNVQLITAQGVPPHLSYFAMVFQAIYQKDWDKVQLGLSRILLDQMKDRWIKLRRLDSDNQFYRQAHKYLLSYSNLDGASIGGQGWDVSREYRTLLAEVKSEESVEPDESI